MSCKAQASISESEVKAPGGAGKSWLAATLPVALISLFAELGLGVINNSALPAYLPIGLGLSAVTWSAVMAPFFVSEALFKSPLGVFADRWGRKPLMVVGPAISIFTPIIFISIQYPPHRIVLPFLLLFGFLRALDGVGAAALWPAMFAYIGDHVDHAKRASAMSLLNVTYMMGLAIGIPLGGWADNTFGPVLTGANSLRSALAHVRLAMGQGISRAFHVHHGAHLHLHALTIKASQLGLIVHLDRPAQFHPSFYLGSVLFACATIVAVLALKDRATDRKQGIDEHGETVGGEVMTWPKFVAALKTVPNLMLIAFVAFMGIGCIALNVKPFAMTELNISETDYGLLLLKPAIIIAALAVPLGHVSDRFGKVQSIRCGFVGAALGMWAIVGMYQSAALRDTGIIVGGALLGIGFVLAFPAWMALLTTSSDRLRGTIIGAVSTAQGVGTLAGVGLGAFLYDHGASSPHIAHITPFAASAIVLSTAAFLTIVMIRTEGGESLPKQIKV